MHEEVVNVEMAEGAEKLDEEALGFEFGEATFGVDVAEEGSAGSAFHEEDEAFIEDG